MSHSNWRFPEPGTGPAGILDQLTGPGPEQAELVLQFGAAVLSAGAAGIWYASRSSGPVWLLAVTIFLAFDIGGGVITNATSTAKRWFHRQDRSAWSHMAFQMAHLLHIAVVSFLYGDARWTLLLILSGALIAGSGIVLLTPLYLKRPAAFGLYGAMVVLLPRLAEVPAGLEWFIPLFYLKLILGHLLPEEPYRPGSNLPGPGRESATQVNVSEERCEERKNRESGGTHEF
ncbi:hypothetical protein [Salinispira pacifica]|uniref:Uncharacterized protein n=1 Tax=Salinispira pacifica TaxID=1307761 RepID=V5WEM9_9SPIO|nr:hypothetical protein [Salinispira pacifica]AHC14075.1 hypothetical protein L21SP2_0646 [Salinispira pacifica]